MVRVEANIHTEDDNIRIRGVAYRRNTKNVDTILDLDTEVISTDLIFKKPGGTNTTVAASIVNGGSGDGKWEYITPANFFDGEAGIWSVQPKYNMLDGAVLHGNAKTFEVKATLTD